SNAGSYDITASGAIAPDYTIQYVNGTLMINSASTATVAAVSAATPLYGIDGVTLSAMLSVFAPGAGSPTGTVEFFDGDTSLGTANVINGTAVLPLGSSALAVGQHNLRAVYSGDDNFFGSDGLTALQELLPGSLGGYIYEDTNDNGAIDLGEKAIEGEVVHL